MFVNYRKNIFLLIILSTAVRCSIAGFLEFGNDEVYYWTYAQHLQWNYFDHPPGVAVLIRLSTLNLLIQNEFFIRLGAILFAAVNTWVIYLTGKKIQDEKTGWYAALLYTSSFYCSVIAGTFILPDSPQLFFWVMSIYLMTLIIDESVSAAKRNRLLLVLGITIGCCVMSKIHGIFLWAGFGAYILFFQQRLLRSPALYLAAAITLIILSPIIIWNIQNHFVTYSFHGRRVGFFGKHLDTDSFLQQLFGSIFYNNPVNFVLYIIALVGIARMKINLPSRYVSLFLLLGLPLIGILLLVSLFNETLPHWSGPAYISILLLTAGYFAAREPSSRLIPTGILVANLFFLGIVVVGIPVIRYIPARLGDGEQRMLGKGDVTLDMVGWDRFSRRFDSLYRVDVSRGLMKKDAFIISDFWYPAAHLDYYLARPNHIPFMAIGGITDIHQYAWLNVTRPAIMPGSDAYFIFPSNYYGPPKPQLRSYFDQVDDSVLFTQERTGVRVRNFVIYRLHGYRGGLNKNGVFE
jgi:4-amino-4-deoxy-L-arabinose transferase-like glycosyltransferase